MAEVKWIKIATDIFDDEKTLLIESLPDAYAIIVVWFKLLCLAGKMNNSGVFMMNDKIAYTDKMLSTIFRMNEATVQLALQTFQQFGMIEIIDGVITIPNWGKHQSLEQLEARREYQKEYQREYRKKQKALADSESLHKRLRNDDVNSLDIEEEREEEKEREIDRDKDKKKKVSVYFDSPSLNEAFLDYIKMRKLIKKPMSDRAINNHIEKLKKLTATLDGFDEQLAIEIIDKAIDKNWLDFYPLKEEGAKKSRYDEVDSWV